MIFDEKLINWQRSVAANTSCFFFPFFFNDGIAVSTKSKNQRIQGISASADTDVNQRIPSADTPEISGYPDVFQRIPSADNQRIWM